MRISSEWTAIVVFDSPEPAHAARLALEQAGIAATVDERAPDAAGAARSGGVPLRVPRADVERASAVLARSRGTAPSRSIVELLFDTMVSLCAWLRVAASLTFVGAMLGVVAYALVGGDLGLAIGILLVLLGLGAGIGWANRALRKRVLIELAYGFAPSAKPPTDGAQGKPADDGPRRS